MFDFTGLHNLADITRQQAAGAGEAIALEFEGRQTSYAGLHRHTSQVANGLIALGQAPRARIGYMGMNSDRLFEVMLGAQKANTVLVGVNWRLAAPEVQFVLNDAGCEVLFVGAEFAALIESVRAACPRLAHIIAVDGGHAEWPDYATWRDAQDSRDPCIGIAPDDDAIQLYTSGTTGHPKGVQLTHAAHLAFFRTAAAARWADFERGSSTLVAMPGFHVAGSNMGLLSLAQGCRAVVMKSVSAEGVMDLVERFGIRHAFLVPAVILMLVQHPRIREKDLSSLRSLCYGASPIPEELLKQAHELLPHCGFTQLYGMTETLGAATALQPEDHVAGLLRSCGRAYPEFDVGVRDDAGRELPPGEVGEVVVRSPTLMKGYWNRPEASAEALRGGWMHTGDAGYLDANGYLFLVDRLKDMIVSGGENIYPTEVENAIFGHPAVADVAVIGVPDEKWGEAVKAVVVLKPGASAGAQEIIAHARERIAGYKLPKSVDFIDALPRNPSGKVLRRELRDVYWAGRQRRVN